MFTLASASVASAFGVHGLGMITTWPICTPCTPCGRCASAPLSSSDSVSSPMPMQLEEELEILRNRTRVNELEKKVQVGAALAQPSSL